MDLNPIVESNLWRIARSYLANGKYLWDIPHTICTMDWMDVLVDGEGGDRDKLRTVMMFHDVGYPPVGHDYDFDNMIAAKKHHAVIGARITRPSLLSNGFSSQDTEDICSLIVGHYKKKGPFSHDMQLVIEADGLAKIDWQRQKPNFDKKNQMIYLDYWKGRVLPLISTKTGLDNLDSVLAFADRYVL